ncbi:MAG: TIR domain-containing protein [Planctomycetia bacterium]|nr:TIR domain-containing protein [Planctomycetia bacterium]
MVHGKTVDLFITHAWRYHADWKRAVDLLNAHGLSHWRNFSLPWYDPALDPRTEKGGQIVRANLESQIIPVHAVILLASVLDEAGTRKWLDFEIKVSRQRGKPILVLPGWGLDSVTEEVRGLADAVVEWDAAAILRAVAQHRSAAEPAGTRTQQLA